MPGRIEEYLKRLSPSQQQRMRTLLETIRKAAPDAEEKISYGMPAFAQNGNLVYFAAWKSHVGFYPAGNVSEFREDLAGYKVSKGTIQFANDEPLPLGLVARIVKLRVRQNLARAKERVAKKEIPKKRTRKKTGRMTGAARKKK